MKKILLTGTFDIIHPGHLSLFKQAKKLGKYLIIVVARDRTVLRVKGRLPKNRQRTRLANLKKLKIARRVLLGRQGDKLKIVGQIKPDVLALGYDQHAFTRGLRRELKKRGLATQVVRLRAFRPRRYKSSLLRSA